MAAIEYIEEPDMKWLKDLFRAECTKKNTFVFQLNDEE
jgi:hypothetical protein